VDGLFSFLKEFFAFLGKLIQPGNWPFLVVFTIVLVGFAVIVGAAVFAKVKQEGFDHSLHLGPLWIHLVGGEGDPKNAKRGFRKLVYVQVNRLSNRTARTEPFYLRNVDRLDAGESPVKVFDEAVYTTVKLYPKKRGISREREISSGVVDARVVIPWMSEVDFNVDDARRVKEMVDVETSVEDDTMMMVSHFLNGLQTGHQDIATMADEDAESLRLIVDFSSIPHAADFVVLEKTQLLLNRQPVDTDDLSFKKCGAVYMAHCRNAPKGAVLKMYFTFTGWEKLTGGE
jgi:hypothetical protein